MGISVSAVKARVFHGRKKLRERLNHLLDQRGRLEGMLHERSATPDISPRIRSPAMCVVRSATKGGLHGRAFVCRSIGDFGIPVFHRPGWRWRPKAASLIRGSERSGVRGDRMLIQPAKEGFEYEVKRTRQLTRWSFTQTPSISYKRYF